ncbi:MAG: beta-galactosidase [Candidatus Omnitrophica bacterium]|nr:beta-galactosidase [Candidatus Omnitrophota bacterium]
MKKAVEIKDGILYIDDKPVFLNSADYPYYRDDPGNWDDRLKKIKMMGIDVVSFYVPWRHHVIGSGGKYTVDFDGRTQPNRNVKLFAELCAKNKLWMVVKPGPFIHAETNYGGLPDWVSPEADPEIEPFIDSKGYRHRWPPRNGKMVPAPLSGKFKGMTKEWFGLVDKNVIKDNVYPKGNIIAVQVCNEGLYSDIPNLITDFDYSPSALSLYRKFTKEKGLRAPRGLKVPRNLRVPRDVSAIKTRPDLKAYLTWGEWQSEYMGSVYREYSSFIKTKVPFVINANPPSEGKKLDHWLARVIPERWTTVNYGFTNWLKPVSEDISSFERYSLLSKRSRGINFEENWGFSKLYDERFQYPVVCVFETLLAVANGATGFNVYTAVNTSGWDDAMDNVHEKPYPDSSPIKEDGTLTKKYDVLVLLAGFFKENAADFLGTRSNHGIAWGFYPAYSYLAAWDMPGACLEKLGLGPFKCGYGGLDEFQRLLRGRNIDFQIANIESAAPGELNSYKNIVLYGGSFMDRKTQRKLSKYASSGGRLIFIGKIPSLDENFKKYNILEGKAACAKEMGGVLDAAADTGRRLRVKDRGLQVWAYENRKKTVQFFFILDLSGETGVKEFGYSGKNLRISLPGKSAAMVKVKNSKLNAVFVKGVNEMTGNSVVPYVSFGKDELKAREACDLAASRRGNKWQVKTAGK